MLLLLPATEMWTFPRQGLTLAAHLCHSFSSSCPASSAWGLLLHRQSRRGKRCGSQVPCPCCSSLFSAPRGNFGQAQFHGAQPQLPQLHTRKPGHPLGCKAQPCPSSPAQAAKGRDTSQRQVTDCQAPKEPLSSNATSCPAPFPGCALSLEPQIWPRGAGAALHGRAGNLTHFLHSPVHPVRVTRGKMGEDSGSIDAFPEKGVILEGSQRKAWCLVQLPCTTRQ